jgi:hypothetical protein
MQNNRDSSILRSLAIAFGDGLAFGVGMKLTQKGGRSVEAPASGIAPAADMSPLLERLEAIEMRVGKMARDPVPTAPASQAPFDQKVLEAIVNALDARLAEQAGQMERRITELQAKLAIEIKSLQRQGHAVVSGVQTHIEELNGQFNDQLAAIRRRSTEERATVLKDISSLHREFAMDVERATAQAMDDRVAVLRQEIASRDSQIAELRARLDAGDESLRNVVVAIAQACQTLAARTAPAPSGELPLPGFAQPKPEPRVMPIQLVSSLALVSAAGLAMLHYLQ